MCVCVCKRPPPGAGDGGEGPGEAPAVAVEHGQRPQVARVVAQVPAVIYKLFTL